MTDTAEQERVEDEAAEMEHYCRWSEGVAGKLEGKYGGGDPEAEAPVEIAAATYLRKLASEVRRLRARQREGEREPVAWRWRYDDSASGWRYSHHYPYIPNTIAEPLYTEPPAEREPER